MTELNKGYWNLAVSRGCNVFGTFFSNRVIGDAFMSKLSFIALTKKEKTRQINLVSYLLQLRLVKRRLRGTSEQQIYILVNYLQYLCHIKKKRQLQGTTLTKISVCIYSFPSYHTCALLNFNRSISSGMVTLYRDSKAFLVYCHMGNFGCGDGGWTTVMKIDGHKVGSS